MSKDPFGNLEKSQRKLPHMMFDFIDGGTGCDLAQQANQKAFNKINLKTYILRNVEEISLKTNFLGDDYNLPYGIAPMGMCNLIHSKADVSLSKEASKRNLPHCVSTASSTTLEQTQIDANGNAWFQLYAGSDDDLTFEMVARAKTAGYKHLVFTVDTPRHSRRTRDLENGFSVPLKIRPKQFIDFATHPEWSLRMLLAGVPSPMNYKVSTKGAQFVRSDSRGKSDWDFLNRLRESWDGKLLVKGVNNSEDAIKVKQAGCDAIYVSNHGGRQLDSATPAIQMLPKIRRAVGDSYPIVFDSGIRSGDDVVRAIASGANFVMIGRPALYALGASGPKGLAQFFEMLEEDTKSVMAQIGVTNIQQIDENCIVHEVE